MGRGVPCCCDLAWLVGDSTSRFWTASSQMTLRTKRVHLGNPVVTRTPQWEEILRNPAIDAHPLWLLVESVADEVLHKQAK